MSIFKEMKRTKEWEQWDTQFRADVTTQGLSNVLDPNYAVTVPHHLLSQS